jgi:hypothetical protein
MFPFGVTAHRTLCLTLPLHNAFFNLVTKLLNISSISRESDKGEYSIVFHGRAYVTIKDDSLIGIT